MPVGLLATVLKQREKQRRAAGGGAGSSLGFAPLRQDELPRALPAPEPPSAAVLAAFERYYAGERPLAASPPEKKRRRDEGGAERRRERDGRRARRSRSPEPRDGSARAYDRPLAAAQAEMGVREDGRCGHIRASTPHRPPSTAAAPPSVRLRALSAFLG
jgi:hypothetical protein